MNKKYHYISTYQKDYTWPYVSSAMSICRTQPPAKLAPVVVKGCICTDSRRIRKEERFEWSRVGPMGRLLEPKIYSKIERIPEAHVTRFDQLPSICYGASKKSFLNETITRVDADRMKTTYQADYSDPAARMTQRDITMTVTDTNGQHLRCMPIKIITIKADSLPCCNLPICTESTNVWKRDYTKKDGSKREKKCEDVERRQMTLPSGKSEYQDSISKIGHAIMRAKLHRAKKKPLQYQYTTSS
ncbi:PREDICTED: uncharacterized protein LOC105563499 isoform X2 [Vollenhovia emeryi]|uniref:uncharacterized protein LOC105563499 isoform X2 n=1 Tax=Vollenhovia emeryi TaxID=411798 RepID=UPI0005F43223|nr:PREDICTED: uncharacterized protein LOC105563499 isoform X2 [Vollenhovia emeryi]